MIKLFIEHVIKEKNNIVEIKEYEAHSFLAAFLVCTNTDFLQEVNQIRDTSGTIQTIRPAHTWNLRLDAGAGDVSFSIQVGTGTNPVDHSNTSLQTIIPHGISTGQLQYSATVFGATATDAVSSEFTTTRNFANTSGGTITITEIGLVYRMNTAHVLVARDLISPGITTLTGQTATINYKIRAVI